MYTCNLEFYTAIGKFFYEKKSLLEKKILISSGLFLTIIFSIIVVVLLILNKNVVLRYFFNDTVYTYEYYVSLIWLFLAAIGTYVGVIPRYNNQQKIFVVISTVSLFFRVGSTVFFILVLHYGIAGVLYGHIVGSIISLLTNIYVTKKYIGLNIRWSEIKNIASFSFPLVPGVLLIGLWQPFSRDLISKYYSIKYIGLLSFAVRIASVLEIINYGIRFAWTPLLFENHEKENFKTDLLKISKIVGHLSFSSAIILTLISPEICRYVGTPEYEKSTILIAFLAFTSVFEILKTIRGFGPLILKKTYLLTLGEIGGICSALIIIYLFSDSLGLFGIGLLFLIPSFLKYLFLSFYTQYKIKINLQENIEILYSIILIISIALVYWNSSIIVRYFLVFIVAAHIMKKYLFSKGLIGKKE